MGWGTPWVPVLITIALLIVAAFGIWQHRVETKTQRRPLMKTCIFPHAKFTAANVLMAAFFASFLQVSHFRDVLGPGHSGPGDYPDYAAVSTDGRAGGHAYGAAALADSRRRDFERLARSAVSVSSLLFAIPIPVPVPYWAYGFPAMVLSVCGADTLIPVLTLFVAKTMSPEDTSLGGALITLVKQIRRALGLGIATAVQTAVIASERGVDVIQTGSEGHGPQPWDDALKRGIRSAA